MLRTIRLVVAATVLLVCMFGLFSSLVAIPDPGIGVTSDGTVVSSVVPGSPAWRDGIRPDDRVVELHDSTEPDGWSIVVAQGNTQRGSSASDELSRLRATVPIAILGLAVAAIALVSVVRESLVGLALLPIAMAIGSVPLGLTGSIRDGVISGPVTFAISGVAIGLIQRHTRAGAPVVLIGVGLALVALTAILGRGDWNDPIEAARAPTAFAFALWGVSHVVDRRRIVQRLVSPDGPAVFDLIYVPAVLAILATAVAVLDVHLVLAAALAVIAVLSYPASRRASSRVFERLVVGTMRREAEIRAIEEERGRLAREIHDAPLQGLAAIIRRLDGLPEAAVEVAALREVAGQLRDVATTLHPPVLEDLGLVPALLDLGESLATTQSRETLSIEVDDLTTAGSRPSPALELAAYRIVQEATGNALRHSSGTSVSVRGFVGTDSIEIVVRDNGAGINRTAAERARRSGHFGLDSMRDRAESVGGALTIASDGNGVVVRFTWEAVP